MEASYRQEGKHEAPSLTAYFRLHAMQTTFALCVGRELRHVTAAHRIARDRVTTAADPALLLVLPRGAEAKARRAPATLPTLPHLIAHIFQVLPRPPGGAASHDVRWTTSLTSGDEVTRSSQVPCILFLAKLPRHPCAVGIGAARRASPSTPHARGACGPRVR